MKNTQELKLKTNLDTDFLKVIAIICMVIDHIGGAFFPEQIAFRIIGRIVFPIFCYCMTVGLLYTRDIKKYLKRLAIFAIVSQPFWILAFNSHDILGNIFNMNIFFTLFMTLLALWGFKERKWWVFVISTVLICMFNFDYSFTGVLLMLIFYTCRNKPALGAVLYALTYIPSLFGATAGDYFTVTFGSYTVDIGIFAILAVPLIFMRTHTNIKISKWLFYGFYPAHLFIIYLAGLFL